MFWYVSFPAVFWTYCLRFISYKRKDRVCFQYQEKSWQNNAVYHLVKGKLQGHFCSMVEETEAYRSEWFAQDLTSNKLQGQFRMWLSGFKVHACPFHCSTLPGAVGTESGVTDSLEEGSQRRGIWAGLHRSLGSSGRVLAYVDNILGKDLQAWSTFGEWREVWSHCSRKCEVRSWEVRLEILLVSEVEGSWIPCCELCGIFSN